MKKRLLGDILVYLLIPIILYTIASTNVEIFAITAVTLLSIGYSMFIKYKQYRVNISGIIFVGIYTFAQSLKIGVSSGYDIYAYNTYYMVIASIIFIGADMANKNVIKVMYMDVLKIINYSNLQSNNIIKKYDLMMDFNKISSLISIHLLVLVLIRFNAIINFGEVGYKDYFNVEILANTLFLILEYIVIVPVTSKIKMILKTGKCKVYKKVDLDYDKTVINFNKYKKFNK